MLDPDWPGWISIHAPHEGERHIPTSRGFCRFFISIHAPHEGERRGTPTQSGCCLPFQSTLPTRGSDGRYAFAPFAIPHISIHAPHEGERHGCRKPSRISCIFQSTLPTRGSDQVRSLGSRQSAHFNPRSPRGGATHVDFFKSSQIVYFNPRSPRGGATRGKAAPILNDPISIHAPHEGERPSVPPVGATLICISIHAPHEGERPRAPFCPWRSCTYFNPRSPRGGATAKGWKVGSAPIFQSTLPTRGSDCCRRRLPARPPISIHAPHEGERPLPYGIPVRRCGYFNPRSPRGGATRPQSILLNVLGISIHAPHEGERPTEFPSSPNSIYEFQSTLPTRGSDVFGLQI